MEERGKYEYMRLVFGLIISRGYHLIREISKDHLLEVLSVGVMLISTLSEAFKNRKVLQGPVTISAALFSAIGTVYAIRFLRNGHLNRRMSAALYTLCLMDFMLMMTTVLFLSIEPMSILLVRRNVFYQHQGMILILYGIRNSFAMSSVSFWIFQKRFWRVLGFRIQMFG